MLLLLVHMQERHVIRRISCKGREQERQASQPSSDTYYTLLYRTAAILQDRNVERRGNVLRTLLRKESIEQTREETGDGTEQSRAGGGGTGSDGGRRRRRQCTNALRQGGRMRSPHSQWFRRVITRCRRHTTCGCTCFARASIRYCCARGTSAPTSSTCCRLPVSVPSGRWPLWGSDQHSTTVFTVLQKTRLF
jgi:hypothetical protein